MWYSGSVAYTGDKKREYQREFMRRRRVAYLSDKSCVVCGSTERLEVDHIVPEEKVSHKVWSWAKERREAELAKCQVLCYDHHAEKTREDRKARRKHGRTLYNHGCRCSVCFVAQQKHNAERYLK